MKNEQTKHIVFPDRLDTQKPIFCWAKRALIGEQCYAWFLFCGYYTGKKRYAKESITP